MVNNKSENIKSKNEEIDIQTIKQVIATHSRGIDRLDNKILQSAYWEDAEVDYGEFKGLAYEFIDLVIPALREIYLLTQHKVSNTLITLKGDIALSETYVTAYHLSIDEKTEMTFLGRYLDKMEKRENKWRILHRKVVMDWNQYRSADHDREEEKFINMSKGSTNKNDPLYSFLLDD